LIVPFRFFGYYYYSYDWPREKGFAFRLPFGQEQLLSAFNKCPVQPAAEAARISSASRSSRNMHKLIFFYSSKGKI